MFCRYCGKQIPDQAHFCPYCGNKNQASFPQPGQGQQSRQEQQSQQEQQSRQEQQSWQSQQSGPLESPSSGYKKTKGTKGRFPLLIAVILLAAIGAAALVFSHLSKGKPSAAPIESSSEPSSQTASEEREPLKETEEERTEENTDLPEGASVAVPPNSAEDEGNLFGNSHCYARLVSDGTYLYFRNALDRERTYWIEKGETEAHLLTDIYMKDFHFLDGWIYFSRTTHGDVPVGTRDNNIYRMRTDGSSVENLSNLAFSNPQAWLSFETMAGGNCFFVYTDGNGTSVDIGCVPKDGGSSVILKAVQPASVVDNPCVNVVGSCVYFLEKDGLHCVDMDTLSDTLVIPGLSCEEYIIYDNAVYFVQGDRQGTADHHAVLSVVNLDGTGRRDLFISPTEPGFSGESMQMSIYRGMLYFLVTTSYAEYDPVSALYTASLDGSGSRKLMDNISWFNIVDDTLYYRPSYDVEANFIDSASAPYCYIPFREVTKGNGISASAELFDPEPYRKNEGSAASSGTASGNGLDLPADVMAAYRAAMAYPQFAVDEKEESYVRDMWRVSAGLLDDDLPSQFIDRGSYYEVTNAHIYIPHIIPVDTMRNLTTGSILTITPLGSSPMTFLVGELERHDYGTFYNLGTPGSSDYGESLLRLRPDGSGYITGASEATIDDTIYSGSLYFTKDCQVFNIGGFYADPPISFSDYMTKVQDFNQDFYEYGYQQYGTSIYGYPVFDPATGFIVKYAEQFTS